MFAEMYCVPSGDTTDYDKDDSLEPPFFCALREPRQQKRQTNSEQAQPKSVETQRNPVETA